MQKSEIVARVLDGNQIKCEIVSPLGQTLTLTGSTTDVEPTFEKVGLGNNRTLVNSAWAFAMDRYAAVNLPDRQQQQNAEKRAEAHRKTAEWLSAVAGDLTHEKRHGWCSACFGQHEHVKAKRPLGQLPVYLCEDCSLDSYHRRGPFC